METNKESNKKTIYDTGAGEIFFKHFLAGFGQGLGNMFVYLILLIVLYNLFMAKVFPRIAPFLNTLTSLSQSLENVSSGKGGMGITLPTNITLPKIIGQ